MYKQKLQFGVSVKKQLGSGFLVVIMLFLPNFVFAQTIVATGNTTQHIVTSSRAHTTVYQNLTGSSMFVAVTGIFTVANGIITALVDTASTPATIVAAVTGPALNSPDFITFVVPSNYYYEITHDGLSLNITRWVEWNEATTTISDIMTVDNPVLDIFLGIVLFFIAMLIPVWFFKRPWT